MATATGFPGPAVAVESSVEASQERLRPIAYWLLGTGALVGGMVTVGGITRLTRSGLSMTDWRLQVRRNQASSLPSFRLVYLLSLLNHSLIIHRRVPYLP